MYEKTVYVQMMQFCREKDIETIREKLQEHSTDQICLIPAYCRVINMEDLEHVTIRIAKVQEGERCE